MVTLQRTTDAGLLKSLLLRYPLIWDGMADDFSPAPEQWEAVQDDRLWYVLAIEDGEPFGWFALFPQSTLVYELHTIMPLDSRARRAIIAAMEWMFQQVPELRRIVTMVPSWNGVALRFGARVGFRTYGRNPASYMKRGELCDQVLLGISRPEGV